MEDSELKYVIISEVSEYLSHELLQNVGLTNIGIDSNLREYEEQNIDNTSSEIDKIIPKDEDEDDEDTWSIFATPPLKPTQLAEQNTNKKIWCDVGVVKGTTCLVKEFYSTSITNEHTYIRSDNLPDYKKKLKMKIQPGTCYKFRVAGINSCGRGEWSDISKFKICSSGYPNAPSGIKIIQLLCGVSLTWEVPVGSGEILEYSVVLAVKNCTAEPQKSSESITTDLHFDPVYCGPNNTAMISHELLSLALVDKTKEPAIIFRISAKNEKGYGLATRVRWLQK